LVFDDINGYSPFNILHSTKNTLRIFPQGKIDYAMSPYAGIIRIRLKGSATAVSAAPCAQHPCIDFD